MKCCLSSEWNFWTKIKTSGENLHIFTMPTSVFEVYRMLLKVLSYFSIRFFLFNVLTMRCFVFEVLSKLMLYLKMRFQGFILWIKQGAFRKFRLRHLFVAMEELLIVRNSSFIFEIYCKVLSNSIVAFYGKIFEVKYEGAQTPFSHLVTKRELWRYDEWSC